MDTTVQSIAAADLRLIEKNLNWINENITQLDMRVDTVDSNVN